MTTQARGDIIPWKRYSVTLAEVWITFCIATFSLLLFMSHLNSEPQVIAQAVLIGILYLFVVVVCIKRMINRLSIAALMLMVPIAPLAVLLLVISLLPIIQQLQ